MLGNVWEICDDWYGKYSPKAVIDPKGPGPEESGLLVLRGGSWYDESRYCRVSDRSPIPVMLMLAFV